MQAFSNTASTTMGHGLGHRQALNCKVLCAGMVLGACYGSCGLPAWSVAVRCCWLPLQLCMHCCKSKCAMTLPHMKGLTCSVACRQSIGGLLRQLCTGLGARQLPVAARGLLAASAGVRSATLEALPYSPSLSQGEQSCAYVLARGMQAESSPCVPRLQLWSVGSAGVRSATLEALPFPPSLFQGARDISHGAECTNGAVLLAAHLRNYVLLVIPSSSQVAYGMRPQLCTQGHAQPMTCLSRCCGLCTVMQCWQMQQQLRICGSWEAEYCWLKPQRVRLARQTHL